MNRRLFRYAISVSFLFFAVGISFAQIPGNFNPEKVDRLVQPKDFQLKEFLQHPVALRAIQNGVLPGAFKNVTYTYQNNVAVRKTAALDPLRNSVSDKGRISKANYRALQLHKDSIYVGEDSNLIMQSVDLTDDEVMVYRPTMEEVFKDFNLPLQTVPVTLANTIYTIPDTEVTDETKGTEYSMKMEFDKKEYKFDKSFNLMKKDPTVNEVVGIKITIDGYIAYNKPHIEAKYGKNSGYRLIFHADEKADLHVETDVKLTTEILIPVWEFKIPGGDIAEAKVGVFIVIGVGGEVKVVVDINQELHVHSGVHGGTKYYFPTSVHTVNDFDSHCDLDYDFELTELKLQGGVQCVLNIKAKGYDIVNLKARGTLDIKFKFEDNDFKNYAIELGLSVKINGTVKKIDKKFTVIDKYFKIWEKTEKNFGGYVLSVKSADAYHDRVHGVIYKEADTTAYVGVVTLKVKHSNGSENTYDGTTNENGVFAMANIPLVKGDKVCVSITDSPNPSPYVDADIPFKKITLNYADYFTNEVQGAISEYVDTFPQIEEAGKSPANPSTGVNTLIKNQISKIGKIQKALPDINPTIKKINFNNMIIYNGNIEVIVREASNLLDRKPNNDLQDKKTTGQSDKKTNNAKINVGQNNQVKNVAKTEMPKNISKLDLKNVYQVKNLPFGLFQISNVDIKPNDRAKVRINIDGFILESGWITSDGIIITPSEDVNFSGLANPKLSADNSSISVSAIRSDLKPQGTLRMMKGADLKHFTMANPFQNLNPVENELFPEAEHSVIFYDKTLSLMPPKKGDLIVSTGAWEVENPYYSIGGELSMKPYDAHYFEYAGMLYEGRWVGFKSYQDYCSTCDYNKFMERLEAGRDYFLNPELDVEQIEVPIPDLDDINMEQIQVIDNKLKNNVNGNKL